MLYLTHSLHARCGMKMRHIAVILLVLLMAGLFIACSKTPTTKTIEGTLDMWSFDPPSITVNGVQYGLAEGMDAYLKDAEAGKMYKFTIDMHGNVIAVGNIG